MSEKLGLRAFEVRVEGHGWDAFRAAVGAVNKDKAKAMAYATYKDNFVMYGISYADLRVARAPVFDDLAASQSEPSALGFTDPSIDFASGCYKGG